jgi:Flp pilus assembly protein TadG
MSRLRRDDGTITLGLVVLVLAALAAVGLVVDGGAKVRAVQTATRVAAEAARAGAQQADVAAVQAGDGLVLDPARARAAALAVLSDAGVPGSVTTTPDRVSVTASVTRPTVFLGMFGTNTVTGTGSGSAAVTTR